VEISLGTALAQQARNDEAIAAFERALTADPKSSAALDGIATALIAEKRFVAAIGSLKNARDGEALQLDLAIAYERNGQIDQAIDVLEALTRQHPENAQAHVNLGVAYTRRNRYPEAAQEFAKPYRLDPSNEATRVDYLQALVLAEQYNIAAPVARDYLAHKPDNFEALYLAGVIDRGLKNYPAAEDHLSRAVALDPGHYEARYNLGFVLARLGKPAQARDQFEAALRLARTPRRRAFNWRRCCALSARRASPARSSSTLSRQRRSV
jgi:tetratricopeptide (TPR) repeat protein